MKIEKIYDELFKCNLPDVPQDLDDQKKFDWIAERYTSGISVEILSWLNMAMCMYGKGRYRFSVIVEKEIVDEKDY